MEIALSALGAQHLRQKVPHHEPPAPQRPWDGAEGLEREVPSPAPFHTFETPPRLDATASKIIG